MRVVAFLRGVMPSGKNKIPKMSYLVELLKNEGFKDVQSYIQSGNILLSTKLNPSELACKIHDIILEEIGADLSVIIKSKSDLLLAIEENPFDNSYDPSRVHLTFSNDPVNNLKLNQLNAMDFADQFFDFGNACFYMHLPKDSLKKRLNNNYIEKKLEIVATTRNLNVIRKLYEII